MAKKKKVNGSGNNRTNTITKKNLTENLLFINSSEHTSGIVVLNCKGTSSFKKLPVVLNLLQICFRNCYVLGPYENLVQRLLAAVAQPSSTSCLKIGAFIIFCIRGSRSWISFGVSSTATWRQRIDNRDVSN